MRKRIVFTVLVLAFTVLGLWAQETVNRIPRSFSGRTLLVARVNATKLREQTLFQDVMNQKAGGFANFAQQISQWTGVDLDTVHTVWLGVEGDDLGVVVFEGSFDVDRIADTVYRIDTAQAVQREGVPVAVMLPDDKRPGQFNLGAVLDENTLVIGQPEVVDGFIACFTGAEKGLPRERQDLVASLHGSPRTVHAVLLKVKPEDLRKNPWMALFTSAEIAADLKGDLTIDVGVSVQNPDMLEPLAQILVGIRDIYGMLDPAMQKLNPIQELLLQNMDVNIADRQLLLSVVVDEPTITEMADRHILKR